jgi:putative phage-type endonuclease
VTATEILPSSPEQAWHELRAKHIGGSEVAALFGEHPHLTKFELWHRKAGHLLNPDLSDNERVFWGQTLEPAIAMGVSKLHGWNIRKVRRYLTHPTIDGFGGSLDYEVVAHDRGAGVLEIKTADWLIVRDWQDGEPPLSYELQVQAYLAITGRSWGAMAVLVGGNDLRLFLYERRPKTIALIESAVAEFWQSIRDGKEPKPDFSADGDIIAKLYGAAIEGKSVDLSGDNRLPELIADYRRGAAMEKDGGTIKDAAKAEILTKIADAAIVTCGEFKISAGMVAASHVSYERKAYRNFRINQRKGSAA